MVKNYYSILEISNNASKQDIKKAYRKLALMWHPDKNKQPEAHDKFILINEAYLILSDDEARGRYNILYHQYFDINDNKYEAELNRTKKYTYEDPIFEKWSFNARKQAKAYSDLPYENFLELIKSIKEDLIVTGSKSLLYGFSRAIIFPAFGSTVGGLVFTNFALLATGIGLGLISYLGIRYIKNE